MKKKIFAISIISVALVLSGGGFASLVKADDLNKEITNINFHEKTTDGAKIHLNLHINSHEGKDEEKNEIEKENENEIEKEDLDENNHNITPTPTATVSPTLTPTVSITPTPTGTESASAIHTSDEHSETSTLGNIIALFQNFINYLKGVTITI